MGDLCVEKRVVARKHHDCAACAAFLRAGYSSQDLHLADEWLTVIAAEADGWKVKPGDDCFVCSGFFDGTAFRYYKRIDMDNLCIKYDLYEGA